jgi:hypothetical protein
MQQDLLRQGSLCGASVDGDDFDNNGEGSMGTSAHVGTGGGSAGNGYRANGAIHNDPMGNGLEDASNVDLLRYIGDLVAELQELTERTGSRTLSGLLAVAHQEALEQQRIQGLRRR